MEINVLGHSSKKILLVAVIALKFFQLVTSELDYKWCSYELNTYPLPWAPASVACQKKGLRLAVISEQATHDYLTSLVENSIPLLNSPAPKTMWLGLHKDYFGAIRQGDCSIYAAVDYNPIQNIDKDCVVFDAAAATFKAADCTKPLPFLCQHVKYDLAKCYDQTVLTRPYYKLLDGGNMRNEVEMCSTLCDAHCVAFRYDGGACLRYGLTDVTLDGRPSVFFTKALVQHGKHTAVVADIEAKDLCSSLIPVGNAQVPVTSSPNMLQTSYGSVVDVKTAGVVETTDDAETTADVANTPILNTELQTSLTMVTNAIVTTPAAQTSQETAVHLETTGHLSPQSDLQDIVTTPVEQNRQETSFHLGTPGHPSQQSDLQADIQVTNTAYDPLDFNSSCHCSCEDQTNENVTIEQLKEKVKELKQQLFVNKKGLSSWKRKLVSAPDKRTSAKSIGLFGAGILIAAVTAIVILDIPNLVAEIKKLTNMLLKCRR